MSVTQPQCPGSCLPMLGQGPAMQRLRKAMEAASTRASTVLICGESGTGKELVARHIHFASRRAAGPFVPVDCTTLRDTLFESQLFGHIKGAYTGADQSTLGFVRAADGGTLFLDEIGELQLPVQAKLLRTMQERTVVPLGSTRHVPVDLRLIAATHRDLRTMVAHGTFRADLFYRLNVVVIGVPPLRERREDIPLLATHFMQQLSRLYDDTPAKTLSAQAVTMLCDYDWPGNVRELANAVEHAFVMSHDRVLTPEDFQSSFHPFAGAIPGRGKGQNVPGGSPAGPLDGSGKGPPEAWLTECPVVPLEAAERALIIRALQQSHGNQRQAARLLRIERRRLARRIEKFGLDTDQFRDRD